jgi:hypothetical protein
MYIFTVLQMSVIHTCTYIVQNICTSVDYVVILLSELSFFFYKYVSGF